MQFTPLISRVQISQNKEILQDLFCVYTNGSKTSVNAKRFS